MTERYLRKRPHLSPIRQLALGLVAAALGFFFLSHSRPAPQGHEPAVSAAAPPPLLPAALESGQPQASRAASSWALADQGRLPLPGLTSDLEPHGGQKEAIAIPMAATPPVEQPASAALPNEAEESAVPEPSLPAPVAGPKMTSPTAKPVPKPAAKPQAKPQGDEIHKITLTPASTLLQKKGSHFSVQLMGSSSLIAVDQFVLANRLSGKVWVYRTQYRGLPWYVVLRGDHASMSEAQAAIRNLPPVLLKAKPWPKSFADVQSELKR